MKPTGRLRDVIDFLKKQHHLTNDDLSLKLGYKTKTYVSDILGGSKLITHLFLDRLKAYYAVNPEYILGGSPQMIIEKESNFSREKETAISMQALANLTESNKMLAEANRSLADSTKILAHSNGVLVKSTAHAGKETSVDGAAKSADFLELLADIACGKRFESKQEALAELNRFVPLP